MGDPVEQWLEDCLTLPGKLHRALRLMAQLEQDAMRTEDQFQTLEKQFLTRLRHCYQQGSTWPAEEQSEEIHTIKTLHSKCRALLREKVVVNKQIASFIHYEQQRLARERDKLLHSMSGLGAAAAQARAQGGGVDTGVPGGVNAPGGSSSAGAGPSGGNSQAVGGSSSAWGSTAGRSTLRRRGNDRGDSRGGSSVGGSGSSERSGSDAVSGALAAGGLVGPERSVASMVGGIGVGVGMEGEGDFLYRKDSDVQAGALSGGSSTISVLGTGRPAAASGVCPPSVGSDVSVGSSTVPPSKKARKVHEGAAASSRHASSQSSTSGGAGLTLSSLAQQQSRGVGSGAGSGAGGSGGAFVVPAASGGSHQTPHGSSSKSGGGRRHHGQSKTKHEGSSSNSRRVSSPTYFYGTGAQGSQSESQSGGQRGAGGAGTSTGGIGSVNTDAREGICPVCSKGESLECNKMVACDACDRWFHFECVGFSPETQDEDSWFCLQCYQRGLVP